MATLSVKGLVRRYDGAAAALAGLDLEVRDGELLVLVGPSGCGKSTVLRLIAGLDKPDGGVIRIDDRDVGNVPPQDRDVAMVFQGYALYPHLSARDNIAFPLRMRGVSAKERETRVLEVASMLGLTRLLDRRPGELSGGERQRVAMARAIIRRPKVFLFDEPLSNLDAALRGELRVEIAAHVRKLSVTSIYVTHDQVEAMTMGDRIAVLKSGELQQVGTPREVYSDPVNTFVAGFLGSPPINWVDLESKGDRLEALGVAFPVPKGLRLPSRVRVGLRSEHLHLIPPPRPHLTVQATVVLTEPLGSETHVVLDAKGTRLRARVPGFDAPRRDIHIDLAIESDAVLWFDAETGARLRV